MYFDPTHTYTDTEQILYEIYYRSWLLLFHFFGDENFFCDILMKCNQFQMNFSNDG